MKVKDLIQPNELDKKGSTIKLLDLYDVKNRGIGRRSEVGVKTAVVKNTSTGQVTGRRSAYMKTGKGSEALLPKDDPRYS